jgi:hypothetical protein
MDEHHRHRGSQRRRRADAAERVLAELEGGTAAAMAVVLSLRQGDRVVAARIWYWDLRNWLVKFCNHWLPAPEDVATLAGELLLPGSRINGEVVDYAAARAAAPSVL